MCTLGRGGWGIHLCRLFETHMLSESWQRLYTVLCVVDWSDYHSGQHLLFRLIGSAQASRCQGRQSPGWAVSILLQWRSITILFTGNAVPISLISLQNTGDRVAEYRRQYNLTHEGGGCICVWRNRVITTLANELTLWFNRQRSGIIVPARAYIKMT